MNHNRKTGREAVTGRFVVRSEGKDARGNEKYTILNARGRQERTVIMSESSSTATDAIMTRHAKALKRLAEK